jgi:uncharacterized tellurite resistance protein B-like protein
MYDSQVTTQDQALAHLLLHCCLKDGRLEDAEIDKVSDIFVQFGLQKDLNFKNEVRSYREYFSSITDEQKYINYLVDLIMPVNVLALFSWCLEIMLIDESFSTEEEALLQKIADALEISDEENAAIYKLMIQRRVVLTDKIW